MSRSEWLFFSVILSRRRRIFAERFSGVLAVQTGLRPYAVCASSLGPHARSELRVNSDSSASLGMTAGIFLAGIFLAGIILACPALAICTQSGTATSSSSAVVGSNDVTGIEGRHYFMIQNTGTSNPMNVAIGSSNTATNKDLYLGPGASWVMTMQGLKMVPGGDVAVIAPSGNTTYSFCDW
jgi:hypothetical protein